MAVIAVLLVGISGCTSRGVTITSVPEGAEVSINYRVVGKTPIRIGFTHYGTYRIELRKEKYHVLVVPDVQINPPVYGYDPAALVADNLIPARLDDEVYLHYVMKPLEDKADKEALDERAELIKRALAAREGKVTIVNPRTGEQAQIQVQFAETDGGKTGKKKKKQPGTEVAAGEDQVADSEDDSKKLLDKPTELAPVVKEIAGKMPEGMRLAKEYNVPDAPGQDKRGTFVPPEEPKKPGPVVARTPKDEELIYDTPRPAAPDSKKSGASTKKTAK
ncbi:MAG: PEGA domain-containing protein [Planctomycetota bacterium]|nr:PEGA domain-containing protein [Planctomycetota bacterium]